MLIIALELDACAAPVHTLHHKTNAMFLECLIHASFVRIYLVFSLSWSKISGPFAM